MAVGEALWYARPHLCLVRQCLPSHRGLRPRFRCGFSRSHDAGARTVPATRSPSVEGKLQPLLAPPTTILLPLHRCKTLVGPACLVAAAPMSSISAAISLTAQLCLILSSGALSPLQPHTFAHASGDSTSESTSDDTPGTSTTAAPATVTQQPTPDDITHIPPQMVPLVLHSSLPFSPSITDQAGAAGDAAHEMHAAPYASMNHSIGSAFLGMTPEADAVFACELTGPTALQSCRPHSSSKLGIDVARGEGDSPSARKTTPRVVEQCQWVDVQQVGQGMAGEAAVLALASRLPRWHASAAFCGTAEGNTTASSSGGPAVFTCMGPAVVVAAACGNWLLLGRKQAWEAGRFSPLAAFCEAGETLEQTAVRAIFDGSRVCLDPTTLAYHSSHPWPSSSSLVTGFIAMAKHANHHGPPFHLLSETGRLAAHDVGMSQHEISDYLTPILPPIKVEESELEDVRWFHRDYLLAALSPSQDDADSSQTDGSPSADSGAAFHPGARHSDTRFYPRFPSGEGGFRIPGKHALANRMIWDWVGQQHGASGRYATVKNGDSGTANPIGDSGSGDGDADSGSSSSRNNAVGWEPSPLTPVWAEASLLDLLPDVSIDKGTFKYVLLRVIEQPARIGSTITIGSSGAGGAEAGAGAGGRSVVGNICGDSRYGVPAAECTVPAVHSKLIVRGDARVVYHNHIFRAARAEAKGISPSSQGRLTVETVGGGRMEHYPEEKLISVYGYSSAFGQAPHEVTAALLRRWFPLHDITVSYDGY